jgi:hypothetical protein
MLSTINVFDHTIYKTHCPFEYWYNNSGLTNGINAILSLAEVKNRVRGHKWDSHEGEGETSEIVPYLGPANLPDGQDLLKWIKQEASAVLGVDSVTVTRSWMNRMLQGSQGRCHIHSSELLGTPDLVAIFYVDNPHDGSQLVIVNDNYEGQLPSDIPDAEKECIPSISGDLIMHSPNIWHAVSQHNSTIPRICFVYQFEIDNNP